MINDILTAISQRLSETTPEIKYIDEDWGQLDYYNDNPPVRWPAVLLEIQQTTWKNQSLRVQDGEVLVSIRLADIKTSNTSLRAPETQKENASAIWLVMRSIHQALHGWRPQQFPYIESLSRISTRRIKRDDGIREFEIIYSCNYTDDAAKPVIYNIADESTADGVFGIEVPEMTVNVETVS